MAKDVRRSKPIVPTQDAEPLCAQYGFAERRNDKYRYAWDKIHELWKQWPVADLQSFSRAWGVPYTSISKRPEFNVALKRTQLQRSNGTFRTRVVKSISIATGNVSADPKRVRELIDVMMQAIEAGAKLARARLCKEAPDGTLVANATISSHDLHKLTEVLKSSSATLRELMFLAAQVPSEDGETVSHDEPDVQIVGSIGVKKRA